MSRRARIVAVGYPHHITQRGNYKQITFANNIDYFCYLKWLNKDIVRYELLILAYCLMPNHVHFVAIPQKKDSLAKTFNCSHMRYSLYFNKKNNVNGHLWQGRFYSCILDEKHLYATVRYIENNPVRAKLVERAEDWEWSSARYHLQKGKSFLPLVQSNNYMEVNSWEAYIKEEDDEKMITRIRKSTLTGRPCVDDTFIKKLEKVLERSLDAPKIGRPCRSKK